MAIHVPSLVLMVTVRAGSRGSPFLSFFAWAKRRGLIENKRTKNIRVFIVYSF